MELKKWLFLLLALTICQVATAQLTGKVVDNEDNYPLEYTSVAIYKTLNKKLVVGTISNKEGVFSISDIKPGSYYLKASFLGYQKNTVKSIVINKKERKKG